MCTSREFSFPEGFVFEGQRWSGTAREARKAPATKSIPLKRLDGHLWDSARTRRCARDTEMSLFTLPFLHRSDEKQSPTFLYEKSSFSHKRHPKHRFRFTPKNIKIAQD
ncbi:hypothetical protein AVEN_143234-1 [Araneus ventricosus]|uniref:Uncharacterized protein n=1 Tax=Araneus ventricosus TaxID=182803 RepID=A0A4Y2AF03_ARAVE|nr:hypothetical protein AVEN_143234-1 [Araneus ventricosus]